MIISSQLRHLRKGPHWSQTMFGSFQEFRVCYWKTGCGIKSILPTKNGDVCHSAALWKNSIRWNCAQGLVAARGWRDADHWRRRANTIAPTLVGGSKKHGGPDLGPTRAKRAGAALGVDGLGLWDEAPPADFIGMPRMTARIQGFPDTWAFVGRKTAAYRQIGNAFPPPVAAAVARQIRRALADRRLRLVA